jgi:magnesium chelatase family protein
VLKNKNDSETTASRKPLFHQKDIQKQNLSKITTLAKTHRQTRWVSLLVIIFLFGTIALLIMKAHTRSVLETGFGGILIDVECHLSNGLPNMIIVGFASKAVDESKERVRSAFASSSINLPKKRITINLAPADIQKDSTSLDLAIASSILTAGKLALPLPGNQVIIGELSLDGTIRPVRGIIGKLLAAKERGITDFILPAANLEQASLVPGVTLFPVSTLKQLYAHQRGDNQIKPSLSPAKALSADVTTYGIDFSDIIGQQSAKRSLEIAAAGGHNILMSGPPGTGKSMLAKAAVTILPPLSREEALEVTHLHSLSNHEFEKIITARPFRTPHHSASDTAIVGGGKNPRPGEISLSHRGILFLDELPEFKRTALESLRQPLEDREITVSRAKETINFPANFILVATANPCPCGFMGTHKACTCSPQDIARYQRKLSGPILDRIDIFTDVENVQHDKLLRDSAPSETSSDISKRVYSARLIQAKRYGKRSKTNSDMSSREIKQLAFLTTEAESILNSAAKQLELSPRSYMRTIKVARTIADLASSTPIEAIHVTEAIQYRPKKLL